MPSSQPHQPGSPFGFSDAHGAEHDEATAGLIARTIRDPERLEWGPPWVGPILHRAYFDLSWLCVAVLMIGSALIFFGWRGLLGICTTGLSTLTTYVLVQLVARLIRPTRLFDSSLHVLTQGLFLGLAMPVVYSWHIPTLAGVVLGGVSHVVGRSHRVRVHPVAASMLIIWLIAMVVGGNYFDRSSHTIRSPHAVLRIERVVIGDVCNATASDNNRPWLMSRQIASHDALVRTEPNQLLLSHQRDILSDRSALPRLLMKGELLPMADLVLGASPGAAGASSRALLIAIGLTMMYRRLVWWPMAATVFAAGVITLLAMPLNHHGQTTTVVWRLMDMRWSLSLTYLGYMILASPMAFIALILAPQTAPTSVYGKLAYAAAIGSVIVVIQWFASVPLAGHLSLVFAGLFSRALDAWHKNRFAG